MEPINKNKIIEFVSNHYCKLPDECQNELIENTRTLSLEKGHILVKEGQFADKTYFVYKGCARAYYLKSGKDITDWFAFENEFISSINSFFLNVPSPHYIEILETSILLEISRSLITELSQKYHAFERLGSVLVTKTMLELQQRIVSIQFETAKQKYESLLALRPDITQRIPLTHIASYLGITLETLSRVRNPRI